MLDSDWMKIYNFEPSKHHPKRLWRGEGGGEVRGGEEYVILVLSFSSLSEY